MTTLREAAQQALGVLIDAQLHNYALRHDDTDVLIVSLRAALAAPIPHGCHVDLEEGMEPDGCVLDEGRPDKCIYARRLHREGKDKTTCGYWKPIEVNR